MAEAALVKFEKQYPALSEEGSKKLAIMRENLEGESISKFDLDWVTMPMGKTTFFEVKWDAQPIKSIEGIIIHHKIGRALWEGKFGENPAPVCVSEDAVFGVGVPGGECAVCEFNEFGSATEDDGTPRKGKACPEKRHVWMLIQGVAMPIIISVPPTSLKHFKKFVTSLDDYYWNVITRVSLAEDKHKHFAFEPVGPIPAEAKELVARYRALMIQSAKTSAANGNGSDAAA